MSEAANDLFDPNRLQDALNQMSDEDLAALEDDLDFCNFTGIPSMRVLEFLKELMDLDKGWQSILDKRNKTELPYAY